MVAASYLFFSVGPYFWCARRLHAARLRLGCLVQAFSARASRRSRVSVLGVTCVGSCGNAMPGIASPYGYRGFAGQRRIAGRVRSEQYSPRAPSARGRA